MTGKEYADCDVIRLPNAVRETIASLKAIIGDRDPAPWRTVSDGEFPEIAEDELDDRVRLQKLGSRAIATLQRSLINGELKACFRKDGAARAIPGWAWESLQGAEDVWFHGVLALDPQLPLEWESWSGELVYLERNSLEKWMDCQTFDDDATFPEMPEPWDLITKPELVGTRPPPSQPFVGLSEALSWIAFRFSMNRDQLNQKAYRASTLSSDPIADLAAAVAQLASRASGGQIALRGKYYERHSVNDSDVLTEAIDPIRLDDFAQYDILHDGLRYGRGLTWQRGNNSFDRIMLDRLDCYRSVKVNRADLLKHFPAEDDLTRALLSPIPAMLPGVGPVMRLDEALSIFATGKLANDVEVWANRKGEIAFRSPNSDLEAHRDKTLGASVALQGALRDGTLQGYISPPNSGPLCVPRLFWIGVNPDCLEHAYRAEQEAPSEPILLSRAQFAQWQAGAKPIEAPFTLAARAPSVKTGRAPSDEQILEKADEMKARGMRGYEIAQMMRHEAGFEHVATTEVRDLIKGRYKPAGRPKVKGAGSGLAGFGWKFGKAAVPNCLPEKAASDPPYYLCSNSSHPNFRSKKQNKKIGHLTLR